jgi:hypothetical protein
MLVKERSIICRDDEVRAFIEGRKTQIRRPLIGPDTDVVHFDAESSEWYCDGGLWHKRCPFGVVGDRLWGREAFATVPWKAGAEKHVPENDHDEQGVRYRATWDKSHSRPWRPSSQMPPWASRITLDIIDVRVERLQDITEQDALAEGVQPFFERYSGIGRDQRLNTGELCADQPHRACFAVMWDERSDKDHLLWIRNPFVWVIQTKVIA